MIRNGTSSRVELSDPELETAIVLEILFSPIIKADNIFVQGHPYD